MNFNANLSAVIDRRLNWLAGPIEYHVVDVSPRPHSATGRQTLNALRDILIGSSTFPLADDNSTTRLLFVGATESLDQWEVESEAGSAKKDLEFYVRTLQSNGLAHYGYIPEAEYVSETRALPLTTSLLIQLLRIYDDDQRRQPADAGRAQEALRCDVIALLECARAKPGFSRLGQDDERRDTRSVNHAMLLEEINVLFQLGKRNDDAPKRALLALAKDPGYQRSTVPPWEINTSYDLKSRLEASLSVWAKDYLPRSVEYDSAAGEVARLTYKLRRYELLRDLGRVIGSGTLGYLRERWDVREREKNTDRARRYPTERGVFIIDDELFEAAKRLDDEGGPGEAMIGVIAGNVRRTLKLAGLLEGSVVAPAGILLDSKGVASLADEPALYRPHLVRRLACGELVDHKAASGPECYLAILIDPDSTVDYVGPIRIQWIERYLRRRCGRDTDSYPSIDDNAAGWKPPIVAFSKTESAGNVQQALNAGAAAYVPKDREFHLLFDIRRAIATHWESHRANTGTASQFRALSGLKRNIAEKLQYKQGPNYIYGGLATEEGHIPDAREETWLRQLPKSDLHCHFGTCVPFAVIEALALNTVGYALPGPPGLSQGMLSRVSRCVVLAEHLAGRFKALHPMLCLAAAADAHAATGTVELKPFGLGDEIVQRLKLATERHQDHDVVALLVAVISVGSPSSESALSPSRVQGYLRELCTHASAVENAPSNDATVFDATRALRHVLARAQTHLNRIGSRWDGTYSDAEIRATFVDQQDRLSAFWSRIANGFETRTRRAKELILALRSEAEKWLRTEMARSSCDHALAWLKKQGLVGSSQEYGSAQVPVEHRGVPLERYVCAGSASGLSETSRLRPTGLQRYLWGADLLGAPHFQYPDNLLLATFGLTFDNASDNVVYCEVRCETSGYTVAGMGALDATDLLRHGFNLASLLLASAEPVNMPLVRTNILLAAKRHKEEYSVRQMISLMEGYLDRRPASADDQFSRQEFRQIFPRWWRPCNVVGFDISGDESRSPSWLVPALKPLTARSSAITIHAGEAADAQSIWKAVYELNATRIGHGLRLAEDSALLSYCVREGICMEMCPNSNRYTNGFHHQFASNGGRDIYPLHLYMERGLEVAISSDNRYLHPPNYRTLTSEYVAAARLLGGLTRWEVLQVVKAGFKNAFLDKRETKELVQSVEEWVYRTVSRGWF